MDVAATAEHSADRDISADTKAPDNATSNSEEQSKEDSEETNESNKFQKAIAAWRNIDFANLLPSLDSTASDLVAHQRDSLVERKELAQKTKDFRKLDDASKLNEIKSLLKAYQSYIDLISNQSKTVSSSFLQLYSSLSEAPDPYPLLEASVDSLVTADVKVPSLEAENAHLQKTTEKLTTQLEDTERRLAEEQKAKKVIEDERETKIKQVEASWSAVLTEKQDNWSAREKNLEERTENQDRLLKELKASYEVSQRLERGQEADGNISKGGASAAELEIVSSDLERANSRLADVEARNEQLRVELAQATTQKNTGARDTAVEDDPAFLRLRSENSALLRKADSARLRGESQQREWDSTVKTLRNETNALKAESEGMRNKLQKWNDYEDIKQELEVLKSIEFATGDDDDKGGDETEKDASANGNSENLERLLLGRNKKLNDELTVLRVSHQDLSDRLEALQEDLSTANMELEKSRNLNATLENDLTLVQQEAASTAGPALSVAGSRFPRRGGRASPTSSIISGFDTTKTHHTGGTLESLRSGASGGGGNGGLTTTDSGILPMVTAQRDRFRQRNTELENDLNETYKTVQSLRSEVASLQKDNLNLYEKTRYVSTFQASGGGGGGAAAAAARNTPPSPYAGSSNFLNPNPSSVTISDSGNPYSTGNSATGASAPFDRYRSAYESRISPFQAFRGRESARALKRMTLPERLVFQVTRLVLATRTSRNLFAMYCVAMHLLVFGVLWYLSTVEIEKHSTQMGAGAAAGAAAEAMGGAIVGAGIGGSGSGSGSGSKWQQDEFDAGVG